MDNIVEFSKRHKARLVRMDFKDSDFAAERTEYSRNRALMARLALCGSGIEKAELLRLEAELILKNDQGAA